MKIAITENDLIRLKENHNSFTTLLNELNKKIEKETNERTKKELINHRFRLLGKINNNFELYKNYITGLHPYNYVNLNDYVTLTITKNNNTITNTYRLVSEIKNPLIDIKLNSEIGTAIFRKKVPSVVFLKDGTKISINVPLKKANFNFIEQDNDLTNNIIVTLDDFKYIEPKITYLNNSLLDLENKLSITTNDNEIFFLLLERKRLLRKLKKLTEIAKNFKNGVLDNEQINIGNIVELTILYKGKTKKFGLYKLTDNINNPKYDIDINSHIGSLLFGKTANEVLNINENISIIIGKKYNKFKDIPFTILQYMNAYNLEEIDNNNNLLIKNT